MGRHSKKWRKFPEVCEYANANKEFAVETEEHVTYAWNLARGAGWVPPPGYTPRRVWLELAPFQPELCAFFHAIVSSQRSGTQRQAMMEHIVDYGRVKRLNLDGSMFEWQTLRTVRRRNLVGVPSDTARLYFYAMRRLIDKVLADGGLQAPQGLRERTPFSQLGREQEGPLDYLLAQLRPLFEGPNIDRLHQCPTCRRFFLAVTDRQQEYCDRRCRRRAHPTPPEKGRQYTRKCREKYIPADLQRIEEVKMKLRAEGEKALKESWVLEEAKMHPRHLTTLKRWELEHYGEQRITDLSR